MGIARYALSAVFLLLSAGAAAGNKCDPLWDKPAPPQHIIAMNQHAADMVLALDAGPQMLGVSYIDDSAEALKSGRYRGIPIFSAKYPATEKLIASGADFVVAGFSSAFMASMGGQDDLQRAGIGSYLMAFACERQAYSGFDSIKMDLQRLGRVLGREKEADAAVARIDATLAQVKALPPLSRKPTIFYLDSQSDTLMSQGKKGFMTEVITLAGGENMFINMPVAGIHVSPETLLDKQPDYIILADAVWSPAEKKKAWLANHPALSHLEAVKNGRYIVIPFSGVYPNVKSPEVLLTIAEVVRQ